MKVMVLVKATAQSEAGQLPSEAEFKAMGDYNEALVAAGILLAGEGLHPSRRGHRVRFSGTGAPQVSDGPFASPGTLVAGFWLWQVRSMDEALEWIQRAPFTSGEEIELRQVMAEDDLGEAFTDALRAQEQRLRERIGGP